MSTQLSFFAMNFVEKNVSGVLEGLSSLETHRFARWDYETERGGRKRGVQTVDRGSPERKSGS